MLRKLLIILPVLALLTLTAVCLHSLEEIHYLKTFLPSTMTVQQACYAGVLEIIKLGVIALPLILLTGLCLFFYHQLSRDKTKP